MYRGKEGLSGHLVADLPVESTEVTRDGNLFCLRDARSIDIRPLAIARSPRKMTM